MSASMVLVCRNGEKYLTRDGMQTLAVVENGSVLTGHDGLIKAVGPADIIESQFNGAKFDSVLDASGMCVLPGLVDAHTHPVWAGDRVHEFAMKFLLSFKYMEVHEAGGGIHFTMTHTCSATERQLLDGLKSRLDGYGLELDTEVKMLRVINSATNSLPIGISATYCGAHAVPKYSLYKKILPYVKIMILKDNLGAELDALAISHLEEVTGDGIAAMAKAKTSAVLLPINAYILQLSPPRARDMLDAGVIVALGSDFNPNAYCCSMPMAGVLMKMSMPEALAASTINAAYALNRSHMHGSLEIGKQGDLVIINAPRWEHLVYQFGGHQELIRYVIIKGEIVYENDKVLNL
uniref:imidazolonepropionase n=1 Tax=Sinocyclocheilus grahami TaxID=75366 RepID=A0A672QKE3_SINGR